MIVCVTDVRTTLSGDTNYIVACRVGYLKGTYQRNRLIPLPLRTASLMGIDPKAEGFKSGLSLSDASKTLNGSHGGSFCSCKTDCAKAPNCSCRKLGLPCTTKCHGGRGNNKCCSLLPKLPDTCIPVSRKRSAKFSTLMYKGNADPDQGTEDGKYTNIFLSLEFLVRSPCTIFYASLLLLEQISLKGKKGKKSLNSIPTTVPKSKSLTQHLRGVYLQTWWKRVKYLR